MFLVAPAVTARIPEQVTPCTPQCSTIPGFGCTWNFGHIRIQKLCLRLFSLAGTDHHACITVVIYDSNNPHHIYKAFRKLFCISITMGWLGACFLLTLLETSLLNRATCCMQVTFLSWNTNSVPTFSITAPFPPKEYYCSFCRFLLQHKTLSYGLCKTEAVVIIFYCFQEMIFLKLLVRSHLQLFQAGEARMKFYDKIFFAFSCFVTSGIEFTWNALYKHSCVKQGVCLGLMPGGKGKLFVCDECLQMSQCLKILDCCRHSP